jgi:glycosyltransferase involved in cell wall biosynthesis
MAALSYGVPIVSTSIGIEGAQLQPGEDVLVADTPAAFASATLQLYRDEALWNRLSTSGQALVREKFSTRMGIRALAEAVASGHKQRLKL